jgi:hypothetical protein
MVSTDLQEELEDPIIMPFERKDKCWGVIGEIGLSRLKSSLSLKSRDTLKRLIQIR